MIMNILARMVLMYFIGDDWMILCWIQKKGGSITPDFDVVKESRRWNKKKSWMTSKEVS